MVIKYAFRIGPLLAFITALILCCTDFNKVLDTFLILVHVDMTRSQITDQILLICRLHIYDVNTLWLSRYGHGQ